MDTAACPGEAIQIMLSPDGDVMHMCKGLLGRWHDKNGTIVLVLFGNEYLVHAGYGGLVLTTDRVVNVKTEVEAEVVGLPADLHGYGFTVRAKPGGFMVAVDDTTIAYMPTLWEIGADGVAVQVGTYPPPPGELATGESALAPNGVLFSFATEFMINNDTIIRRVPDGAMDVLYQEANNPLVKVHGSSLVTGP